MKSHKNQFLFDLEKVYDASYRIAIALPQLIKPDTSENLKQALLSYADEAAGNVIVVEQLFGYFGQPSEGETENDAMDRDGCCERMINSWVHSEPPTTPLDAIEQGASFPRHRWEPASFDCLYEWVSSLGNVEGAELLERILEEENTANRQDTDHSLATTGEAW